MSGSDPGAMRTCPKCGRDNIITATTCPGCEINSELTIRITDKDTNFITFF